METDQQCKCGCDGIGIRTRLKIWVLWVRVPPAAPSLDSLMVKQATHNRSSGGSIPSQGTKWYILKICIDSTSFLIYNTYMRN